MTNPHTYGVQDAHIIYQTSRTPHIIPWSGVKEINLDRAYRDNYKVHNDGIFCDYLMFGEEVGVSVSCYSYPNQLSTLVGRRVDRTGVVIDGGRPTPFTLLFRIEREDNEYSYIYVPRVMLTPSGVKHTTMSDSIEPVEYMYSGEAIPIAGTSNRPSVYTIELQKGLGRDYVDEVYRLLGAVDKLAVVIDEANKLYGQYIASFGYPYQDLLPPPSYHLEACAHYLSPLGLLSALPSGGIEYHLEGVRSYMEEIDYSMSTAKHYRDTYAELVSDLKQQG